MKRLIILGLALAFVLGAWQAGADKPKATPSPNPPAIWGYQLGCNILWSQEIPGLPSMRKECGAVR